MIFPTVNHLYKKVPSIPTLTMHGASTEETTKNVNHVLHYLEEPHLQSQKRKRDDVVSTLKLMLSLSGS